MKRGFLLGAGLALVLASQAAAMPPRGSQSPGAASSAPPRISYSPPGLAAPVAPGTAAGTAMITNLPGGGTWSMTPTSSFNVNSSTGAVTTTTTVYGGTYTPTLTYTDLVTGQTVAVSLTASILVTGVSGASGFFFPSGNNLITAAAVF